MESIYEFLKPLGEEMALFIVSMIPLIELRGGIILGHALGMPALKVLAICFLANCVPVPFVIYFIRPIFKWMKKFKLLNKLVTKIEKKAMEKSDKVKASRYEMLGLMIFVAIPCPGTGAYTGSLIAALLNMRIKHALPVIILGVLIAGIIMTVASMGVFSTLDFLV